MDLNQDQRPIVEKSANDTVKIIAGAGTGKTRVLVARYLRFVFEDGIPPDRLLALTFTKKAAAEMHKRVFDEVVTRGDKGVLHALYVAWILNFHQFAYRVIRENASGFGLDPDVSVASQVDMERAWRSLEGRFESGAIEGLPETYDDDMPAPNSFPRYFEKCRKIVTAARGTLWTPEKLRGAITDNDVPPYRRFVETVIAVWRAYERELHDQLLLDFTDLMRITVEKFREDDELRNRYAGRFDHILVDEFQDTSELQNEMLRLLSGEGFPRVTVVGDEKQSIYRWRDARIENIREFGKDREPSYLRINYRSTQDILDLAHRLIIEDEHFAEHADEIHLRAHRGASVSPIVAFHPEDGSGPSPAREAKALGAWILALTGRSAPGEGPFEHFRHDTSRLDHGDIAILMRSLKPSHGLPELERELQNLHIPYAILGGVSAVEERVLQRFSDLLRLLIYPEDVRAFLSVIESWPIAVPDTALKEMFDAARVRRARGGPCPVPGLWSFLSEEVLGTLSDEEVAVRLRTFRDFLETLDERRSELDLAAFVVEAIERSQFYYHLFSEGADLRLVDSVSKRLFELLEGLTHKHEANLAAFIESIHTLLVKKQLEDDAPYVPPGRVLIMTQHQAKGLEFPAVAIPGIKNSRGSGDGFYLIDGRGLFLSDAKDWGRGTDGNVDIDRIKEERRQEERCLLYVAITRAEDHLFISSPHPRGDERRKETHKPQPNLFASVLTALADGDLSYEELRVPPESKPTGAVLGDEEDKDADRDRVLELVNEWQANRERLEEARVAARPFPQGLQFVTWRGLHAFDTCPLRYYYRYVAGIEDDPTAIDTGNGLRDEPDPSGNGSVPEGIAPEDFGRLVHQCLYEWFAPDPGKLEDLAGSVADRFGLAGARRARAIESAASLIESTLGLLGGEETNVHHLEWALRRRIGRTVFHGVVDRVDRSPVGIRIIDYKVGAPRDEYRYQVLFYAWLAEAVGREEFDVGLVAYCEPPGHCEEVDCGEADRRRVGVRAEELVEVAETGTYPARPGQVCARCEFKEICPHAAVAA